jgi:diguanylate cyclase (GGDEF)-like protein
MRLTRLFMFSTSILLGLVMAMLVRSVVQDWRVVQSAEGGLDAMELAYAAMKVAEKASAERGPTIIVLNDTAPADLAKIERLEKARIDSDGAMEDALLRLARSTGNEAGEPYSTAKLQLLTAKSELAAARLEVDRVAKLPFEDRKSPIARLTRKPIDSMFAVIDTVLESVTLLSAEAEKIHSDLSLQLIGARYAAELREYAGRLGSQFTTALASQKPLGVQERNDIPQLIGRIQQLRKLVEVRSRVSSLDPRLAAAIQEMNQRYFEIGLPLIAQLTNSGLVGGAYGIDSTQFITRYVPEMKSLVLLRDRMFEVAREGANTKIIEANKRLKTNFALGFAALLIETIMLIVIQKRVLSPLLLGTRHMQQIIAGQHDVVLPTSTRTDEIGDLQTAVVALKETTHKKLVLEGERERLLEQLKFASERDFLTGLLNRRALLQQAGPLLAQARRQSWRVSVVLFDIDFFKRVNDQYGHTIGDHVLKEIAVIAQAECRQSDLLARYGGEEFILLAFNCAEPDAIALAERIRTRIEDAEFRATGDQIFRLTASFGIAGRPADDLEDLEGLIKSSDKALYAAKAKGRNCLTVESFVIC